MSAKIKKNDEVEKHEVPDGGHRIYIDEEAHWIVRKMDVPTYKKLKQMIRAGKDSEGAVWAITRLMVVGTCDPQGLEEDLNYLIAMENAVADLIEPMTAQIKKK